MIRGVRHCFRQAESHDRKAQRLGRVSCPSDWQQTENDQRVSHDLPCGTEGATTNSAIVSSTLHCRHFFKAWNANNVNVIPPSCERNHYQETTHE